MSMQNFGGVKEVHYGIVQVVNAAWVKAKNLTTWMHQSTDSNLVNV